MKLATWNANSLKGKLTEFKHFVINHDLDIVGVCETKFCNRNKFHIPGFKTYRLDRNSRGGGVIISVKNKIDHEKIILHNNNLEAVGVKITNKNKCIKIFQIYIPPKNVPILIFLIHFFKIQKMLS